MFLRLHFNCISLFFSSASKPRTYPPLLSFKFNSNSDSTSYHCTQIRICIYTNIPKHHLLSPHNAICMCDFRADFLTLDMFGQWCWWDFVSLLWLRNSLRAKHLKSFLLLFHTVAWALDVGVFCICCICCNCCPLILMLKFSGFLRVSGCRGRWWSLGLVFPFPSITSLEDECAHMPHQRRKNLWKRRRASNLKKHLWIYLWQKF